MRSHTGIHSVVTHRYLRSKDKDFHYDDLKGDDRIKAKLDMAFEFIERSELRSTAFMTRTLWVTVRL